MTISASRSLARGGVQHLADGEESDGDDDDVDAVEQLRDAEGEPRHAGQRVDADHAEQEPEEQAREAVEPRLAEHGGHRHEREDGQREVLRRPEAEARAPPSPARRR